MVHHPLQIDRLDSHVQSFLGRWLLIVVSVRRALTQVSYRSAISRSETLLQPTSSFIYDDALPYRILHEFTCSTVLERQLNGR